MNSSSTLAILFSWVHTAQPYLPLTSEIFRSFNRFFIVVRPGHLHLFSVWTLGTWLPQPVLPPISVPILWGSARVGERRDQQKFTTVNSALSINTKMAPNLKHYSPLALRSACSLSARRIRCFSSSFADLRRVPVSNSFVPSASSPRVLRGDDPDYHRLFGFHRRSSSPSCVHIAYYKCGKFSLYFTAHGSHLRPPEVPTYNPAGNERHHHYKFSPPVWSSRSLTTQPLRVIVVPL